MQAGPLLLLQPSVLFVTGDADDLCSVPHLRRVCKEMQSSDIRFVVMKVTAQCHHVILQQAVAVILQMTSIWTHSHVF